MVDSVSEECESHDEEWPLTELLALSQELIAQDIAAYSEVNWLAPQLVGRALATRDRLPDAHPVLLLVSCRDP